MTKRSRSLPLDEVSVFNLPADGTGAAANERGFGMPSSAARSIAYLTVVSARKGRLSSLATRHTHRRCGRRHSSSYSRFFLVSVFTEHRARSPGCSENPHMEEPNPGLPSVRIPKGASDEDEGVYPGQCCAVRTGHRFR